MELERLFCETDRDTILVNSPVVVAYGEETKSFPCRICGAICITVVHSYNKALQLMMLAKEDIAVRTVQMNFEKIIKNCSGTYHKLFLRKINRQKSAKVNLCFIVVAI